MVRIPPSFETRLAVAEEQQKVQSIIHVELDYKNRIVRGVDSPVFYDPRRVPNIFNYLHEEKEDIESIIILGPFGSAKTSTLMNKLFWNCCTMPKCKDGVRRSRIVFMRNTYGRLKTTTVKTWDYWTQFLPVPKSVQSPAWQCNYKFNDKDGSIEIETLFLALEHIAEIEKLGSLEPTFALINELSEMPRLVFDTLGGRIGRYPAKDEFKYLFEEQFPELVPETEEYDEAYKEWFPYKPMLYADSNAPNKRHWIKKIDDNLENLKTIDLYHQPAGCIKNDDGVWENNPNADNLASLSPNYYLKMRDGEEGHFEVKGLGHYGTIKTGKLIFGEFRESTHVATDLIKYISKGDTLWYGFDFGLTPCWLLCVYLKNGRLLALKEIITEEYSQSGIEQLANFYILPYLSNNFLDMSYESVADPSGEAGNQNNNVSNIATLKRLGIKTRSAKTNIFSARKNAVKHFLGNMIEGLPALQIDRQGCPTLIDSFTEYVYKEVGVIGKEQTKEMPDKDKHPYTDINDCLQYICCEKAPMKKPSDDDKKIDYTQFMSQSAHVL